MDNFKSFIFFGYGKMGCVGIRAESMETRCGKKFVPLRFGLWIRVRNKGWVDRIQAKVDQLHDIIMAVGNHYPNETRYETALRYVRQAERGSEVPCQEGLAHD